MINQSYSSCRNYAFALAGEARRPNLWWYRLICGCNNKWQGSRKEMANQGRPRVLHLTAPATSWPWYTWACPGISTSMFALIEQLSVYYTSHGSCAHDRRLKSMDALHNEWSTLTSGQRCRSSKHGSPVLQGICIHVQYERSIYSSAGRSCCGLQPNMSRGSDMNNVAWS